MATQSTSAHKHLVSRFSLQAEALHAVLDAALEGPPAYRNGFLREQCAVVGEKTHCTCGHHSWSLEVHPSYLYVYAHVRA